MSVFAWFNSHMVRQTIATLLRQTIAILLRKTLATLLRKTPRATPQGANFRASESKASSSLECSAERSRESTKLTFYCVKHHEQPRRGESLFASTEQPVYRLSPLYPEGKGDLGESGGAPLQVKRGRGSFRKSRNLS